MQAIDEALLRTIYGWGEALPFLRALASNVTTLGGSRFLIPLTVLAGVWLFVRGRWRSAVMLLVTTLGGRMMVELMKSVTSRPRPALFEQLDLVTSQSFPSGHAANSLITYLTLALLLHHHITTRVWLVPAALAMSAAIGLTRPLLGVHWPSDVLAGWAFGISWTLTVLWIARRWMEGDRMTGRPSPPSW